MWFNKSRRAQSVDDYETWLEGGVVPTLNGFDNGDIRATTVIVVRMREGKPGGGKGPLMSEDKSLTLATANDQTIIIFKPHQTDGARIQGDVINTLLANMGTGGNNMPMVASIIPIHDKATRFAGKRKLHNGEYVMDGAGNGLGIGDEGDPMNTLTQGDRHAIAFSHTQGLDIQPSEEASPTLRANGGGMAAQYESVVRRLTPLECERLQGFPDGWTEGQTDTNRYKQMGNAVAVPVVEWLIDGIVSQ